MKFFFKTWTKKQHVDFFGRLEGIEHSTHFTVDGVPFSAVFDALIDNDIYIYIYHEPEHSEATVIYNEFNETRINHVEFIIKNHFEDAVALADLIRNEKLKRAEEAQCLAQ